MSSKNWTVPHRLINHPPPHTHKCSFNHHSSIIAKKKKKRVQVRLCFHCRQHGFNPWSGNQNTTWCTVSSVAQSCPTLCDATDCSTPGLPVHRQLPELTQTHVHWVGDAIQPSHPLSSPSPPAFNLSQHQGLFQWVSSSHQVAKVLELQLQYQSFQRIFRTVLL